MTWTIFLTIVATASVTQIAVWLKDHLLARREGKFSALYAALFFEKFATECSRALGETETHISSDGHHGTWSGLPSLPEFPKEIDWRRVGIGLTENAFGFRVAVESKQAEIQDRAEFDPPDGGDWPTLLALTEFGLEALELAGRFRKSKWLGPAPMPNPEYTTLRHLTERREHQMDIHRKSLERAKHSKLAMADLAQPPVAVPEKR